MTLLSLLFRNLAYFWRGNLAVLLGVLVGGTVLTGALFVGDSLQGSLREQTLRRLGWVDHALVTPHFFSADLTGEVAETASARVSPAMLLRVTASAGERRARGITLLGVEKSFFATPPARFGDKASEPLAWVSRATAEALGVDSGDKITLQLQKAEAVPREAGLGKKDVVTEDWAVTVAGVLEDGEGGAFNLQPEILPPRNVFVALPDVWQRLGSGHIGRVNALLASGDKDRLDAALKQHLSLTDWGLSLWTPNARADALVIRYDRDGDAELRYSEWLATRRDGKDLPKYAWVFEDHVRPQTQRVRTVDDFRLAFSRAYPNLSLESEQLLLPHHVEKAALAAAQKAALRAAPALVYLTRMDIGKRRVAGVVAALDAAAAPPLGLGRPLADEEILLFDHGWDGDRPAVGSTVAVRYKPPESHGPAPDRVATFTLAGFIDPKTADPFLTPDFPGITNKDDIGAWDLPFDDADWKKNVSREYGDPYWKQFRGTPKAYVTLARGKQLWGSERFGDLTSIRLALPDKGFPAEKLEKAAKDYRRDLLAQLDPKAGGFVFDDVKGGGLKASEGGTPFGMLFLGFSFFLILSSLLLVGFLYRLNLDRRARQVGVLSAEGFSRSVVGRLLLGEGLILALAGALLGVLTALVYSRMLVDFMAWLWPGGALRSLLRPHASASSMAYGVLGAVLTAALTVWWVTRSLGKLPPRALLAGQTTEENESVKRSSWLPIVAVTAALVAAALLTAGFFVRGQMERAGTFFGSGMLLLTAGLCGVRLWMRGDRAGTIEGRGTWGLARLGVRNAARHPARSLLAVGLLASAVFLIVAVESFRRTAKEGTGDIHSADGGFALMAESDLPVIRDLNLDEGRNEVLAKLRARLDEQGVADAAEQIEAARELLQGTTIVGLRARAGDDASCLNLYQPRNPRVLGVPEALIDRGGFVFDAALAQTAEEKANPWLILEQEGRTAAFGEANTVTYMLGSGVGQVWPPPKDRRDDQPVFVIAGLLHDSVFQSSLLISEENFLRLYPAHEGYNFFLIAPPPGREGDVKRLLERALADRGFHVTATKDRLAAFLAVENTYLSTFQALGGLGLLLGSLGLAVVLLRAVWERRGELALLRALGYTRAALGWLVLSENAFLLLTGLLVGTTAALLSILPQLAAGSGSVPWRNLGLLFAGVLALALGAAAAATAAALRAPIVPALRRE